MIDMGKVIALDNHRLLCGDAENKEDVDCLIGGAKIDLLITDPPYGIDIVNPVGGGKLVDKADHQLDHSERERERANGKVGKPRRCTAKII